MLRMTTHIAGLRRPASAGRLRIGLLALALLLTAGCALTVDARSLGVPATLSSEAGQPPQGAAFQVNTHAVYALWGAISLKKPSVRKQLASQLIGGTGIQNVRVRVRSRWTDLLVTGLTLGLITPRTVTVEGVVVGDSTITKP